MARTVAWENCRLTTDSQTPWGKRLQAEKYDRTSNISRNRWETFLRELTFKGNCVYKETRKKNHTYKPVEDTCPTLTREDNNLYSRLIMPYAESLSVSNYVVWRDQILQLKDTALMNGYKERIWLCVVYGRFLLDLRAQIDVMKEFCGNSSQNMGWLSYISQNRQNLKVITRNFIMIKGTAHQGDIMVIEHKAWKWYW